MPTSAPASGSGSPLLWRWWWLPVAVLALILAVPRMFGEHWPSDAPYYQAISAEMARSGGAAWWSPMQGDLHYFNKPPLAFWVHGAMVAMFGDAVWAAKAPEAAFYVMTCLLLGWLACRLHGPGTGMLAGCLLALTSEWVRCVGNFRLEFLHTMLLLGAVACWVRAVVRVRDKPPSVASGWRWVIGAGVCIGGALMTKPLIGLGLPALGLAWLALAGMLTRRSAMIVLVSGAVGLLIALPWHVSMLARYGESFSHVYFWEQSFQRATGERFHHRPWDWYFELIAGRLDESINAHLMWPLYASAIAGLAVVAARWRSGVHRVGDALAAVWTLAWLIALCVFSAKQNYYLLVVHPGAAWLSAIAVAVGAKRVGAVVRPALARAAVVLAGVAAVAVAAVSSVKYLKDVPCSLPDDQRALVRFMAEQRGEAFYNGGLAYPEAALLYLKTGVWVRSLVEKAPVAPALVPSGALMVYREDHPASTSADPADPEVFNAPLGGGTYTVRRRHGGEDVK